jgi:hypothetical protein
MIALASERVKKVLSIPENREIFWNLVWLLYLCSRENPAVSPTFVGHNRTACGVLASQSGSFHFSLTAHDCILVVEDFEPIRRIITSIIQEHPHLRVISEVSDGLHAVQKAEELTGIAAVVRGEKFVSKSLRGNGFSGITST